MGGVSWGREREAISARWEPGDRRRAEMRIALSTIPRDFVRPF